MTTRDEETTMQPNEIERDEDDGFDDAALEEAL